MPFAARYNLLHTTGNTIRVSGGEHHEATGSILTAASFYIVGLLYAWVPAPPEEEVLKGSSFDARGTRVQVLLHAQRILGTSTAIDSALLAPVEPEKLVAVSCDSRSLSNPDWQQARRSRRDRAKPGGGKHYRFAAGSCIPADYTEESMAARCALAFLRWLSPPVSGGRSETLVRQVGTACGEPEETERVIASYRRKVAAIAERARWIPEAGTPHGTDDIEHGRLRRYGKSVRGGQPTAGLLNAAEAAGIPDHTPFTEERMLLMDLGHFIRAILRRQQRETDQPYLGGSGAANAERGSRAVGNTDSPGVCVQLASRLSDAMAATQALGYPEYFPARARFPPCGTAGLSSVRAGGKKKEVICRTI